MKRKFFLAGLFVLSSIVLASCASTRVDGPLFESFADTTEDEALVYLLRPRRPHGDGVRPKVFINDEEIVELAAGGYSYLHVPEGRISVTTRKAHILSGNVDSRVVLDVEAGKRYFLTLVYGAGPGPGVGIAVVGSIPVSTWDNIEGEFGWRETSSSNAKNFLKRLRYIPSKIESLN